ncbi:DUF998 domain-containing protein [Salinisphaera sp.]|uniref:DUF998 domain-containing protein n=1 Tax=Salinisphaera sp. TaxID=1914330 RepID=UPI002D77ADC5|nr:DUF998 domain-containing protein [Salinisphaera sp.]HET7315424.1 DUF998 domain-containing protein [Salinisphaera sp.]
MTPHYPDTSLQNPRASAFTARLYRISAFIAAYFLLTLAFVQLQRPDQPLAQPISHYLAGPYSSWLRMAAYLLGFSFALFGIAVRRTFRSPAGTLVMLLMLVSTLSIIITTRFHAPWPHPEHPVSLFDARLHFSSAVITFICAFMSMIVLTALIWRLEAFRRRRFIFATLNVTVFITLVLDPLLLSLQGGLEKLVTLQMLTWQILMIRYLLLEKRTIDTAFPVSAPATAAAARDSLAQRTFARLRR